MTARAGHVHVRQHLPAIRSLPMSRLIVCPLALAAVLVLPRFAAADDFKPLFDGTSLEGWTGDKELWSVADGAIVGTTDNKEIKQNSFLSTTKNYKNFVLKLKFKLRNGNSGIQIRSEQLDNFVVKGYQADIADNQFMGILYEERGRGILANVKADEVAKVVKKDDWNEYVITVDGARIKQELNGLTTVDFEDQEGKGARDGIIALQLHVGPKMRIDFKDIQIKELP
jgi:hypothetical protein